MIEKKYKYSMAWFYWVGLAVSAGASVATDILTLHEPLLAEESTSCPSNDSRNMAYGSIGIGGLIFTKKISIEESKSHYVMTATLSICNILNPP